MIASPSPPGRRPFSSRTKGFGDGGTSAATNPVHTSRTGSTAATFSLYRDASLIKDGVSSFSYIDNIDRKGGGTHLYKLRAAGTSICSNTTTVVF